jgi:hypothetical protein
VGGVAAVLLGIGATIFVRRRKSARSNISTSFGEASTPETITPFNPSPLDTTQQGPDSWVRQQHLLLQHPEGRMAFDPHSLSSIPASARPRPRPVAPVPPGLSSKELARLRTEAWQTYAQNSSDTTQSSSTPSVFTENGETSTSDPRRLQSEVDMQQLHIVRFEPPPPSYSSRYV